METLRRNMHMAHTTCALLTLTLASSAFAEIKWVDPLKSDGWKVEGRIWDMPNYARLPAKAKESVRGSVWSLGQQSAGLKVRFWSNSPEIHLDYQIGGGLSMFHMPATGVSGFDLYRRSREVGMYWVAATKPTKAKASVKLIGGLDVNSRVPQLYTLYLPLYNSVKSLKIGVLEGKTLVPAKPDSLKPIVVYGTSIAQGACATRPGLAWTNILQRKLDYPIVNLGFSGNGRMETEVADLFVEQDAAVYVIDCLPNLRGGKLVGEKIGPLLDRIRSKRPKTPILLVEEAPRDNERFLASERKILREEWAALRAEFEKRKKAGENIFYLKGAELLGNDGEATVDAVHPNDVGMMRYAEAYEKVLRPILGLEQKVSGAGIPATSQLREIPGYNFMARHQEILQRNKEVQPDVVWLGDSIIHFFSGEPKAPYVRGKEAWDDLFKGRKVTNMAYGWDRTENVLWRIQRGELNGISPKKVILSIGTNDLAVKRSPKQVVQSILGLVKEVKKRQPNAELIVTGIIPRRGFVNERASVNKALNDAAKEHGYEYLDMSPAFPTVEQGGKKVIKGLSRDQLHPDGVGYRAMADFLKKEGL